MTEGVIRLQNQCLPGCLVTKLWKPSLLVTNAREEPTTCPSAHTKTSPVPSLFLAELQQVSTTVSSDTSSGKYSSGKYDTQGHPHTRS